MKINFVKYNSRDHEICFVLIAFILFMSILYVIISSRRSFNFDEFQVMYASAALIRGNAYYADKVGGHFPLSNILISFFISIIGLKTSVVLLGRYFILLLNGIMLLYAYSISKLLWDKKTGLMTVSLILATVVFVDKGIEIRHDVFNMLFNTMGCYYALRYLSEKQKSFLFFSGICLGLALASTQKSLIWAIGIILGVLLFLFKNRLHKETGKVILYYCIIIPMPLIISISYLMLSKNEYLSAVIEYGIRNVFYSFAPHTEALYPFPYNRYNLLKQLFFQNHLFYALGFGSIVAGTLSYIKSGSQRIIVLLWAMAGILFYLTAKRPFYQTFLPSVPALAIIVSGMLVETSRLLGDLRIDKKIGLYITFIFLLFVWPIQFISLNTQNDPKMNKQIANISFCLNNLKEGDKVLCFTQNQIFFDPILNLSDDECGKRIFDYHADCFERKMNESQCKVIINDYRTGLLNWEIQEKIKQNYLTTNIGDILIPGFTIGPKSVVKKEVWITGYYYSPSLSLKVNGKEVKNNLFYLEQDRYLFENQSERPISLIYIFHPNNFRIPI